MLAHRVRVGLLLLLSCAAVGPAQALVFTVDDAGDGVDTTPGNGVCRAAGNVCTFRAALMEANAFAGADTIEFAIGAVGSSQTITLTAELLAGTGITQPVTINGYTQGGVGYTGPPLIELSAAACGVNAALDLRAGSSGSTIRGLVINRCPTRAIRIAGSSNNVISGNYLGTDLAGTAPGPGNQVGVLIGGSATPQNGNRVGGTAPGDANVISANTADGVQIIGSSGQAINNLVLGNHIGTNASGNADLGNTNTGVAIFGGADNNTIGGSAAGEGNVISGNNLFGVAMSQAGTTGNRVEGNRIGTNAAGTAAIPNAQGAVILSSASGNTIGGAAGAGNLISGNALNGVYIDGAGSNGNTVSSNRIGTDVGGTADLGNGLHGVQISGGASNNVVGGASSVGNVISGNDTSGVDILGSSGNRVAGNLIGLDITGTVDLGNTAFGVAIAQGATGNSVGEIGGGNVISGNGAAGVRIVDFATSNNLVQLNYIGLDITGALARPNSAEGVILDSGGGAASGNIIGGVGLGNVISGNGGAGVRIRQSITATTVAANLIGRDATDSTAVPNGGIGVLIEGSSGNTIGGTGAGAGNTIVRSTGGDGIAVVGAATGDAILGNSIFSNDGLGIDLGNDGVSANDIGDADGGANNLQNFPVLSAAMTVGGNVNIAGSLSGAVSTTYRVELFASDAAQLDPTGFGEGRRYLGFANVTTDASGNAAFGVTLLATPVLTSENVTATATDPSNNTSEFSAAMKAVSDLVVTTTADVVDAPSTASISNLVANPGADGRISLREAILATNATLGSNTIRFGIPLTDANHRYYRDNAAAGLTDVQVTALADAASASSPAIGDFDPDFPAGFTPRSWYRIQPSPAPLPSITDPLIVNGETQPGFLAGAPVVEIDGSLAGAGSGLSLMMGPSTVRGLVINRCGNEGLALRGAVSGYTITGNYLGTDVSGTLAAGNGGSGIFIGEIGGAASTIGGDTPAERNIISANGSRGLYLWAFGAPGISSQIRIQGNYIGTDVTGTVGLGVQTRGMTLEFTGGHVIGGGGLGEGNLISGNVGFAIELNGNASGSGTGANGNLIEANRIGTNAAGTAALPNTGTGVILFGTVDAGSMANSNTLRANVIAAATGGGHGVHVAGNADGNVIENNFIGTDSAGTLDLGNTGNGILVATSGAFLPTGNTIRTNTIRFNDTDGVRILGTGASATLKENAISTNDALGIDLGGDGATANDINVLDVDTGPNELMNYPSFPPPVETAGTLNVTYGLDLAAGFYRIEFFKNAVADPSFHGEGQQFASAVVVNHPGGRVSYGHGFAGSAGEVISATTTLCTDGLGCATPGSTSEFSFAWAAVTTAVELYSFTAVGKDESVRLEWKTASELHNLGFHLHRSLSEAGPWTRITPSLIPGLGSSPVGASYSWNDTGLSNGTRYFYRLEDVDTASVSTFHGPVSAVPEPGDEKAADDEEPGGDADRAAEVESFGDPTQVAVRVLSRTGSGAVVELRTGGFYATRDTLGRVRASIPGFELPEAPRDPALPRKRVVLDAVVGRKARVRAVESEDIVSFRGLAPAPVGFAEMRVEPDGTVRPARREASLRAGTRGLWPRDAARISGAAFQGEGKKLFLELAPLRFDVEAGRLVLARRLVVRVSFEGREIDERGSGRLGRRRPPSLPDTGRTLAVVHTSRRGLHAVSFESLFPGRSRPLSVSGLALLRQGEPVAFRVEPATGRFGPGSVLYFHADREAPSTAFTGEVAWELVDGTGGRSMATASAAPVGDPVASPSRTSRRWEVNRIYQPGLLEATDPWLWEAVLGGASRSLGFALSGLEPSGSGQLSLFLQGGSDAEGVVDHHVRIFANDTLVGETRFDGKTPHAVEIELAAAVLREGSNTLRVENAGDTGVHSVVFVDRFAVDFPQGSGLRTGLFEGTWAEAGVAAVAGAPSTVALDVSDPASPVWLTSYESVPSSLRLRVEAGRRYLVVSSEGMLSARVGDVKTSDLRSAADQADYVVIAPEEFLPEAQPLLVRRQSQGLTTKAVSLEEIALAFGHGQSSAEAVRSFLSHAFHSWAPSPRYVLLLGDASYDPRNFSGSARPAPLPALWTKTSYLWTASDPTLAAVNGEDTLPDIAIGRLPATTKEQARALVAKVLDWEDSRQGLAGAAVLVADNPDPAGDFEADVEDIRASFLAGRASTIKLRELGGQTRPAILEAFDRGASLMSYVGHGGAAVWASENVLNSWDVPSLQAQSRQPLMLTLNCLNGYFVAPAFESLSEAFLKAEGRGTIAAVSPSGLSLDGPAHLLHRALMSEITSGRHERLGDLLLAAQQAYADSGAMPELLAIYHLFGDPGMTIRQ